MTPRLLAAALTAATLGAAAGGPASAATVRIGTWSGYGHSLLGNASISGPVAFTDGATSTCSARVTSATSGSISCWGGVAFAASCVPAFSEALLSLVCLDTARNLHVEATAVVLPTGRFTGTLTYERL